MVIASLGIKRSPDSKQRMAKDIGLKADNAGIFRIKGNAIGIDLAAKEENDTGYAVLREMSARTMILKGDDEIIEETLKSKPAIVAIDAPLSLPKVNGISREADRALVKKGFRCFWPLLPSMKPLTLRGIKLKEALERYGLRVIEVFPSAFQKIMGIPTKKAGKEKLLKGLAEQGITFTTKRPSHHELDAVTAALTGLYYMAGQYEAIGGEEGQAILPVNPQSPEVEE